MRITVQHQAALIGAPLLLELLPRQLLRLGWPGGFLRGRRLRGGELPVDDDKVVCGPFPQPGGALRPGLEAVRVHPGDLGHAGVLVDGVPLETTLACSS